MKIILAFKTHFDIGFTDLSEKIVAQYAGPMLSDVIATCRGTSDMGPLRYVWTMPAWPLTVMQGDSGRRAELDELVRKGQIAYHALAYTSHTDFCGLADMAESLRYAAGLSAQYGLPMPVSAKMTDVPGHGRALPMLLANAGVRFLHLGCNAFATPPAVPSLFFWQGPDGSRVLTMYSKGGYGSAMTPPEDWPFPVWMALMHTQDNCGPQSAERIRALASQERKARPDAEIVCGTMDDFCRELEKCDLSALPVVTGDLADSWIHGVGSYPAEVRQVRQARRDIAAAEVAVFALGGDTAALEKARTRTYDALSLFGEHTWGLDVKTWMDYERVYEKEAFRRAKSSEQYRYMECSWDEQRQRARTAAQGATGALDCVKPGTGAVFNPNGAPFTGWLEAEDCPAAVPMGGRRMLYAENVPPLCAAAPVLREYRPFRPTETSLENHRYRLTYDGARGVITELYDKRAGRILARERDGVGVFSYQYDLYGAEEMTEYLRAYAYRFYDWGIRDNGKDNYPEIGSRTFRPQLTACRREDYTLTLCYRSEATEPYGDGREIRVSVTLPPEGEELFVQATLVGKEQTPYVESGSLCVPLAADEPAYRLNKNGDLIDPERDIVPGANHAMYCMESFVCAGDSSGGLCVVSHDAPLCAIGETGIYRYRRQYERHEPVLYFDLFNNMWGTNFPQWIGGDLQWRFTLFGYTGACDGAVMGRALALDRGARYLPTCPGVGVLDIPAGMQVLQLRPEAGQWLLYLRDTAMEGRQCQLAAPGWMVGPVDLLGRPAGEPAAERAVFSAAPFGLYGFRLSRIEEDV